ncbi:MAG: hypothetical protein ABI369_09260, partial [Acetobacteraceae bacterium]
DHRACVVTAYRVRDRPEDFVVYLPISHTPPIGGEVGVELPDAVKLRGGLDRERQWILTSECNIDIWPNDLRTLPGKPGRFQYGHLPPSFFATLRNRFVERYRHNKVARVRRPT